MVGVGAGAQARVAEEIQSLGSNLIIVLAGTVTSGGVRLGTGSKVSITEDDAWAIQREVPSVEVAAPSVQGKAQDGQVEDLERRSPPSRVAADHLVFRALGRLGESRAVRTEPIALRRLGCLRDENSELASAESAGLHAGKVRATGEHRQDAAPSGACARARGRDRGRRLRPHPVDRSPSQRSGSAIYLSGPCGGAGASQIPEIRVPDPTFAFTPRGR